MRTRARLVPVVVTALVAALAGVGALAWYALAPTREAGSGGAAAHAKESPTRAAELVVDPASAPAPDAAVNAVAATRDEEEAAIPENSLQIIVCRAEDHAPLAGATVFWAEESMLRDEREWRGGDVSYVDENELVESVCWFPQTTDARGRCIAFPLTTLPPLRAHVTISARHGELWALVQVAVDPERRSVTIELSAADAIRVQVLGADGKPLPGVIASFGAAGQDPRQSRRAMTVGRDAIATIRGVAAFARLFGDPDAKEWGASVALPLRTHAFTPVDLRALPTEPVVVRVPACGRMSIALRDRDGHTVGRTARVRVTAYPRPPPQKPGDDARSLGPSVSAQLLTIDEGWIELPFVDVGLSLDVTAEVDRVDAGHALLDGPDAIGEHTEVSLALDYGTVVFNGMLLSGEETPVAGERIELHVVGNRGATMRGSGVRPYEEPEIGEGATDEQGKFSIRVPVVGTGPASFDCEMLLRSATGVDRKLAAIAVVAEKDGAAFMGRVHVPQD